MGVSMDITQLSSFVEEQLTIDQTMDETDTPDWMHTAEKTIERFMEEHDHFLNNALEITQLKKGIEQDLDEIVTNTEIVRNVLLDVNAEFSDDEVVDKAATFIVDHNADKIDGLEKKLRSNLNRLKCKADLIDSELQTLSLTKEKLSKTLDEQRIRYEKLKETEKHLLKAMKLDELRFQFHAVTDAMSVEYKYDEVGEETIGVFINDHDTHTHLATLKVDSDCPSSIDKFWCQIEEIYQDKQ